MLIFLRTLTRRTTFLMVDPEELIESVKAKVYAKEGVPIEFQRLMYANQELLNGHTLSDYNIEEDAKIQLHLHAGLLVCIRNRSNQMASVSVAKKALPQPFNSCSDQILTNCELGHHERVQSFFRDLRQHTVVLKITVGDSIANIKAKVQDVNGMFPDNNVSITPGRFGENFCGNGHQQQQQQQQYYQQHIGRTLVLRLNGVLN